MKEMIETDCIEDKDIDATAIHRNEVTSEMEGKISYIRTYGKKKKKPTAAVDVEGNEMSELKKTLLAET